MNTNTYPNKVTLTNSGLPGSPTSTVSYTIDDKQKDNGKKTGEYNYEKKEFNWDVEFNFNYNLLTNAVFTDVLDDPNQQITKIKVLEGIVLANGTFDVANAADVTNAVGANAAIGGNTISFNLKDTSKAYKVTYTTKLKEGIFPFPDSPAKYTVTNTATLTDNGVEKFKKIVPVTVEHTEKVLDKKTGTQIGTTMGIKWNFQFNYAQSALKNVKITDTFGLDNGAPNQIIDPKTFKVYEVTFNGTNSTPTKSSTPVDPSQYTVNFDDPNHAFVLNLPDSDKAYFIEYESTFIGVENSKISNKVKVDYETTEEKSGEDAVQKVTFDYGANAATQAATFVIVKTDGATGDPMEDVVFTLVNSQGRELLTGQTDDKGILDFGYQLAEGDYTLVETNVPGYDNKGPHPFTLDVAEHEPSGEFVDKQIVDIENFKTGYTAACTDFTLTIKDVDGNPVANKEVVLTNKATGKQQKVTTGNNGEVMLLPADFKVADYTVTTIESGTTVTLGEVEVTYDGNCKDEIAPTPSCTDFTITVEDDKGVGRPNLDVVLEHKDDSTIKIQETTDQDGKFTVPSTSTKTGVYKVYEGKQYLGDVTITYKTAPCEAKVQLAPTCETFTLTVNNVDGKPREAGVDIKIVDTKDPLNVHTGKTDADGKVNLTTPLPAGEYDVFEGTDPDAFATFTTNADCEEFVQPALECPVFTITVKDGSNNARPNVTVELKGKTAGTPNKTATTNANGEIELQNNELLPAGKYDVYDGKFLIDEITITYLNGNCEAEVKGAPTCPDFTLTVQDRSGKARDNIQVKVKDANDDSVADKNGDITITTDANGNVEFGKVIERGTYTVYEVDANGNEKRINSFTVETDCFAEVKPSSGGGGWTPPAPSCDVFTVTVKQDGKTVGADVELTLKSGTTEVATGKTDANGKIVFDKADLPEGSYKAYDKDGNEVGTITVTYDEDKCQAEIDLPAVAPSCDTFTVTVKQSGKTVEAGTVITLQDATTNKTVAIGTTDKDGKIVFDKADLPEGSYKAYDKDGKEVGTITVTYEEGKCQASIDLLPKVCETFTLVVTEKPNANVEVKDKAGKTIVSGKTDSDGEISFTQAVKPGTYVVHVDGENFGEISVADSCEKVVIPGGPVDPEEPGTDPEEPGEPGGEGEDKPEKPGEPGNGGEDKPGKPGGDGDVNPGGGDKQPGNGPNNGGDAKPGSGDKGDVKDDGKDSGKPSLKDRLPQTGEEQFMYMLLLGTLFVAAGGWTLYRSKRKKA